MAEIPQSLPSVSLNGRPRTAEELRKLAAWYRNYAERAGNPAIWEARLRTAYVLEVRANQLQVSRRNAVR